MKKPAKIDPLTDLQKRVDDLTLWQGNAHGMFWIQNKTQNYILAALFLAQMSIIFLWLRIRKLELVAE